MTYAEMVSHATHGLGHTLGIGHQEPLVATMEIMVYDTDEVVFPPAVISACDIDAFDAVWAWAVNGRGPTAPEVNQITRS